MTFRPAILKNLIKLQIEKMHIISADKQELLCLEIAPAAAFGSSYSENADNIIVFFLLFQTDNVYNGFAFFRP